MKKFVYTLIFAFVAAASISSCTEQNITPRDGGGSGSNDCGRPNLPPCLKP